MSKTRDYSVVCLYLRPENDSAQDLVEGFKVGGVDFITKPFKPEEALIRVENHVKIHRLNTALTRQNEQLTRINAELQAEMLRRQQAEQSLSQIEEQQAERFHTGGTLGPDSPSYVERRADQELFKGLLRGEFCYVLTARQMGKSSLMARIAKSLRAHDYQVVTLDLTAIGKRIELEDFSQQEIAPLTPGLGRDHAMAAELMDRIYYWTGGHPYLTQELCKGVVAEENVRTAAALDDLCYRLLLCPKGREEDDNLQFVRERLLRAKVDIKQLLDLYSQVRHGQRISADESNPLAAVLRLSGITRSVDGLLRVRNRIYEQVFNRNWIETVAARIL